MISGDGIGDGGGKDEEEGWDFMIIFIVFGKLGCTIVLSGRRKRAVLNKKMWQLSFFFPVSLTK